jgi:radical SAM protein with 4Fe4S-binding SPASM domain
MARTLAEKKVMPNLINVNRLTPHGCALERWESIHLDLQHYLNMFAQAARVKKDFGIKVCVGDGFPLCQIPAEWREFAGQCEAGVTLAAVGHQGQVRLCTNSAGNLGNLLHTPLQEIWTNAEPMSRLRKLDWLPTQCKTCSSASVCKSGCMVSQPNVEYFSCDAIVPSNRNLAEQERLRQVSPPASLVYHAATGITKKDPEIMFPQFSRRYRIRQDILGPLVVLDNGRWFFVDNVDQAVLELCDGRHTRADLCRLVAAQLNASQDEIRSRVNGMLDLLARWGLCEEGGIH